MTLAYIFAVDIMGLSSFIFLWWPPKDASFLQQSAYRPFKVIQGRYFSINRKGVCDFLLVINSNFGPILHRFWDTATYCWKLQIFPTPLSFDALARGEPSRISLSTFIQKTAVLGLSVGGDFVILAYVIFTQCQRVTEGQTDRQTDIPIIANTGLAGLAGRYDAL